MYYSPDFLELLHQYNKSQLLFYSPYQISRTSTTWLIISPLTTSFFFSLSLFSLSTFFLESLLISTTIFNSFLYVLYITIVVLYYLFILFNHTILLYPLLNTIPRVCSFPLCLWGFFFLIRITLLIVIVLYYYLI